MAKHLSSLSEGNEHKQRVILAEFRNGNVTSRGKKALNFTCYKNTLKNARPSSERILVSKSKTMCYSGSNLECEASKNSSLLKLFVVNKRKSSFKMYDVDFFPLKPHVKDSKIIEVKDDKTYVEKSSDLTLTFGSKRQQKAINTKRRYTAYAEISDPDTTPAISETTDLAAGNQTSSAIPPQNKSAISVEEVYNLYDIISLEELNTLTSEAQVFLDVTHEKIQLWKKENNYSFFIVEYLERNMHSLDPDKAKLLCYLHYMFCFLRTVYSDWRKKDPVPSVPQPYKQKLMDSFSVNKSMPQRLKDKLLAHAMVLGLKLCNYTLNCNLFSSSAKVQMTRMTSVAYALGCHIKEDKNSQMKTIQLKLPLYEFRPLPKRRKRS